MKRWRKPREVAPDPLLDRPQHKFRVDGHQPVFDRMSTERRVLAHVTDEVDITEHGPRNTLPAIEHSVLRDDHTNVHNAEQLKEHLDRLVGAGLLTEDEGRYTITDAGWRELVN